MAIPPGYLEIIYCALEEAEGLLAREVLEHTPEKKITQTKSGVSDGILHMFDYYKLRRVGAEWEWVLKTKTTNPSGKWLVTPRLSGALRNYYYIKWLFPERIEQEGFEDEDEYYDWLWSHGIDPYRSNLWHGSGIVIYPGDDNYPSGADGAGRRSYEYEYTYTSKSYHYEPEYCLFSNFVYDVTDATKREYPYLLELENTSHSNFIPTDSNLRTEHNRAVKYIGEKLSNNLNYSSKYKQADWEGGNWIEWHPPTIENTYRHFWWLAGFRNPYDYYMINESIYNRRIDVLKEIEFIIDR
jgi:hypothetical protein